MSDLISRQAAIDMFQNMAYDDWNQGVSTSWADAFSECAEMIRDLPSAQPERKKGKWLHDKDDTLLSGYCSCCGWESIIMETDVADMPYCPNCGSYNGGGDDE